MEGLMKKRDAENINPTPEAVMAMELFPDMYGAQKGGSMDFWEQLPAHGKQRCADALARVRAAIAAHR